MSSRSAHTLVAIVAFAAASILLPHSALASTWRIDAANSAAQFRVKHFVISTISGSFREIGGQVDSPTSGSFDGATVEAVLKAESIDTGNRSRDEHLGEADFLDTETFPELMFRGKAERVSDTNNYLIKGHLTLKGVTHPVILKAEFLGRVKAMNRDRAAFRATTSIDRFDYGVHYDQVLETGGLVVGREIKIELDIELVLAADS